MTLEKRMVEGIPVYVVDDFYEDPQKAIANQEDREFIFNLIQRQLNDKTPLTISEIIDFDESIHFQTEGFCVHKDYELIKEGSWWTGIVYLTPDGPKEGGTGFYKPLKPTSDPHSRRSWECFDFVDFKYNRLVLFDGRKIYHSCMGGFGTTIKTARQTHLFRALEEITN